MLTSALTYPVKSRVSRNLLLRTLLFYAVCIELHPSNFISQKDSTNACTLLGVSGNS